MMETRKIQKVGGGTYTVSIPLKWAQENDIEAGGTAYLYTHRDGSLVLRWNEKEHSELEATTVVLCDTDPRVAKRTLLEAYAAGFKRITVRAGDGLTAEQRRAITVGTRRLTGVEISEERDHEMTVQGLLDASDVSIRQSTLQLRFITLSMLEAATAFLAGDIADSEHIIDRDDEADRIFRLITRHFNRSLLELAELDQLRVSRPQLFEYYGTAHHLKRIADHAVKIVRCVQRTDHDISAELLSEVRSISTDTRQVIKHASDAVINHTATDVAHSALDRCEQVTREARTLDQTLLDRTPEDVYVLTRILDSLIQTIKYAEGIAELRIRSSFHA